MSSRTIFHIDVNSAYLSWEATSRLQKGEQLDIRTVPSVIGGDSDKRQGIVLAKSIPAKHIYNIQTGETLNSACKKCPNLLIVPPNYSLYLQCSNAMVELLTNYSPIIERYSVDEVFLDFTNMENHHGHYLEAAQQMKESIKNELGFTVNIGIGSNKLLAKMASEFKKPDQIHTLFPGDLSRKLWPLPVNNLFMVGKATEKKLRDRGISTIGELANTSREKLKLWLKSHGLLIWNYANGIEQSPVRSEGIPIKGLGNSTTTPRNITERETAELLLLSLTEKVATRLRKINQSTKLISISIKNDQFNMYSKQKKLSISINSTLDIFKVAKQIFEELWQGEPIRHMGVSLSSLSNNDFYQYSLFDYHSSSHNLDKVIDQIRDKHGETSIIRSSFLYSSIPPFSGGVDTVEDYPMMSSLL
ncbi:DNA polymerase IV [Natranaerobius trueperi]|uniref:DNA polymerase IV n=1 Tax=Natranaerobius trueperi TaxID=759412 RepID=A0A226C1W4_9FIRM|nr:DNA polymerase IV [Natranaerobius trueperi]OWZ84429.1 DNA polymerase IV [Natranaerobius trueperi]